MSPCRIRKEIECLDLLNNGRYVDGEKSNIIELIAVLPSIKGTVLVFPYFQTTPFEELVQIVTQEHFLGYSIGLFTALEFVHSRRIIHRDVKPNNYLYNVTKNSKGVLIDFGLAAFGYDVGQTMIPSETGSPIMSNLPKQSRRNTSRVFRGGTRTFKAPEILFGCMKQSPSVDIWAAGIMLLCLLHKKIHWFGVFNGLESRHRDLCNIAELSSMYGIAQVVKCARDLGSELIIKQPANMPTERIIAIRNLHSLYVAENGDETPQVPHFSITRPVFHLIVEKCLTLNPKFRSTATQALVSLNTTSTPLEKSLSTSSFSTSSSSSSRSVNTHSTSLVSGMQSRPESTCSQYGSIELRDKSCTTYNTCRAFVDLTIFHFSASQHWPLFLYRENRKSSKSPFDHIVTMRSTRQHAISSPALSVIPLVPHLNGQLIISNAKEMLLTY